MKKILSWLLVLCMICSLLPASVFTASAAAYSGECGRESSDSVQWSYDSDTCTLTISGSGYMMDYDSCGMEFAPDVDDLSIRPWEDFITEVRTLVIEDGVKSIGCRAFLWGEEITKVILPESLQWIGEDAFAECYALTQIAFPNRLESIGLCAFANCYALEEVVLPAGLTSIPSDAFACCENLSKLYISGDVTYVDDYAFGACVALEDVYYCGDASSWNRIEFGSDNECCTSATIHYNYVPIIAGDISGDGTLAVDDVIYVLKYVVGNVKELTDEQIANADLNGDGELTVIDAILVQKLILEMV